MYVTGKVGILRLGQTKHPIMPKRCVPKIHRRVKKVTFNPVLVTVPEEEEKESVTQDNPSVQNRTVMDISPQKPFREDTYVTIPPVEETIRTLHTTSRTPSLPKECCTVTCLYSTLIVCLGILFLYLSIWLLCFRVVQI
jgi:hypothetical protein